MLVARIALIAAISCSSCYSCDRYSLATFLGLDLEGDNGTLEICPNPAELHESQSAYMSETLGFCVRSASSSLMFGRRGPDPWGGWEESAPEFDVHYVALDGSALGSEEGRAILVPGGEEYVFTRYVEGMITVPTAIVQRVMLRGERAFHMDIELRAYDTTYYSDPFGAVGGVATRGGSRGKTDTFRLTVMF